MDHGAHLFTADIDNSNNQLPSITTAPPSNQSPMHSPSTAGTPSSSATPTISPTTNSASAADLNLSISQAQSFGEHSLPQYSLPPASSIQQQTYASAFGAAQPQASSVSSGYHTSAQYVPHDQQPPLAPLQFGPLGVINPHRSQAGFPYEFDPTDSGCRGASIYQSADMDAANVGGQPPQQLGTAGYIRHVGSVAVGSQMHPPQMQPSHSQQSLMELQTSTSSNLEHSMRTPNDPSFAPTSNQPIFTTLNFQNSQLQEYDSYARPIKRSGRVTKPKRTPRPPNAFILYRKAKQAEVIRDNPGVSNKDVSCIIGQMWKAEDPSVQDKFREQAELEKKKHKELHPNYKYQPRKPKNKRMAEAAAAAAAAAASVGGALMGVVSGTHEVNTFMSPSVSAMGSASLPSVSKDPSTSSGQFQYSKYHLMMSSGQQPQTPGSQHQVSRGEDYYYRTPSALETQHASHHGGFVNVNMPAQLEIKNGFVSNPSAAYWTPNTPSDGSFANPLAPTNVFQQSGGNGDHQQMRAFESMAQHSGHSTQSFHSTGSFDHQGDYHQHQSQGHHGQQMVGSYSSGLAYQQGQQQSQA
ncbi:hypothetical protein FBU59_004390, partial [Linderina macrospora]